jgi:hypothetical protein
MLPDGLYTKGVAGLGEAIPAMDYADIEGVKLDDILRQINERRLLGVLHRGSWYVEAPPFCEERLKKLYTSRGRKQVGRETTEGRQQRQQEQPKQETDEKDLDNKHAVILGLKGKTTGEDIKRQWRELTKLYHPDTVADRGPKIREAADSAQKEINEAYLYFKNKYGL